MLAMEKYYYCSQNIAALNLAGAIDKDQWENVVMDYFLHTVSDLTQRGPNILYKQNGVNGFSLL
jgi:hypothetical protein